MIGLTIAFALVSTAPAPPEPAGTDESLARVEPVRGELRLETEGGRLAIRAAVDGGLSFLAENQKPEGSVGAAYTVATTSLAGLAFLGAGYGYNRGTYGPCVVRCVNYIVSSSRGDQTPGFIALPGVDHAMHGHGYAMLFLTQVYGELPSKPQRDVGMVIRRGIDVMASARSWRGGWYYGAVNDKHQDENSVTVCVLQALRSARNVGFNVEADLIAGAEKYLGDCQNADGSFKYSISGEVDWSSFELTAGAVASLQALGLYGSAGVKRGIDYLTRSLGEVPERPLDAAARYRFYGNFYAAQAFYAAGDPAWGRWYPRAFKALVAEADPARGFWQSRYGDAYATAMAVLILEIPLGYLPMFQR